MPSAQFDVVLAGAVRTGIIVVTCGDEREPMLLCSRDGGAAVIPPRVLVLTILVRGGRVDDDDALSKPLLSVTPMREAVVLALRGGTGEVPRDSTPGRLVPLSPRVGGVGFAVCIVFVALGLTTGVTRVRSGADRFTVVFSATVSLGRVL